VEGLIDELHPRFPEQVWVVVEQPPGEEKRYEFVPDRGEFRRTNLDSLIFARGFSGAYGWISGTGTPPGVHYDALVLCRSGCEPGDVIEGYVSGVFKRGDGDHKFIIVASDLARDLEGTDWSVLPQDLRNETMRVYPQIGMGEGWRDGDEARHMLAHVPPEHD